MTAKRHTTRLSSLRANVHKLFWPITARYGLTPGVKSFTLVHLKESTEKSMWKEEVYLKVAHDTSKPFIVNTSGFEVSVLGTSFNISAYKNQEKLLLYW